MPTNNYLAPSGIKRLSQFSLTHAILYVSFSWSNYSILICWGAVAAVSSIALIIFHLINNLIQQFNWITVNFSIALIRYFAKSDTSFS